MNRFRQRDPDHIVKKAASSTFGQISDDAEVSEAADDISNVAAAHRANVIAKDNAAKARKAKGARRG